jgi:hypothetical protein
MKAAILGRLLLWPRAASRTRRHCSVTRAQGSPCTRSGEAIGRQEASVNADTTSHATQADLSSFTARLQRLERQILSY